MNIPSLGRIVHYRLSATDVKNINKRRSHALFHMPEHIENATGVQVHIGNDVKEGDVFPMQIVRTWGAPDDPNGAVNGQVALDGNDLHWVSSVTVGDQPGSFFWPQFGKPVDPAAAPAPVDATATPPVVEQPASPIAAAVATDMAAAADPVPPAAA